MSSTWRAFRWDYGGTPLTIETDRLGTPRAVAAPDAVLWRWELVTGSTSTGGSNAFGDRPPNEDVDGDGKLYTFELRFPGQIYDPETGLHYNYFRDYEPATGRYVESDPIGLAGGVSTYGYANLGPLRNRDELGLESPQYSLGQIPLVHGSTKCSSDAMLDFGISLTPVIGPAVEFMEENPEAMDYLQPMLNTVGAAAGTGAAYGVAVAEERQRRIGGRNSRENRLLNRQSGANRSIRLGAARFGLAMTAFGTTLAVRDFTSDLSKCAPCEVLETPPWFQ